MPPSIPLPCPQVVPGAELFMYCPCKAPPLSHALCPLPTPNNSPQPLLAGWVSSAHVIVKGNQPVTHTPPMSPLPPPPWAPRRFLPAPPPKELTRPEKADLAHRKQADFEWATIKIMLRPFPDQRPMPPKGILTKEGRQVWWYNHFTRHRIDWSARSQARVRAPGLFELCLKSIVQSMKLQMFEMRADDTCAAQGRGLWVAGPEG